MGQRRARTALGGGGWLPMLRALLVGTVLLSVLAAWLARPRAFVGSERKRDPPRVEGDAVPDQETQRFDSPKPAPLQISPSSPSPPPPPPPPPPLPLSPNQPTVALVHQQPSPVGTSSPESPSRREELAIEPLAARDQLPMEVTWKTPVGCDFSGFFIEVLGYLIALTERLPTLQLDMGPCNENMLSKLGGKEADILRKLQVKTRNTEIAERQGRAHVSVALCHLEHTIAALLICGAVTGAQLLRSSNPAGAPPKALIQHMWPRDYRAFASGTDRPKVVVGRSMCESQILPRSEADACARVDEVWVPSHWHVDVYAKAGVPRHKLVVIPESVDAEFFHPLVQPVSKSRDRFVFFSNFKWEFRKGWDVLLMAYFSEFRTVPRGAVKLVIKSYKPGWEPGPADLTVRMANFARQHFGVSLSELPEVAWLGGNDMPREELRAQYAHANAFVLPTRGEGWGLPAVEAMAMAVPVIATNFSGLTEFLTAENGYPLPFKHVGADGFAEPDRVALQKLMRRAFEHPDEAVIKGLQARQDVLQRLTPELVVDAMIERMQHLMLR